MSHKKTVAELEARREKIALELRRAKAAEARAKVLIETKAETHLKSALGGFCLGVLRDPAGSAMLKKVLLNGADAGITQDPENLARQLFDAFKLDAGLSDGNKSL